MQRRRLPDRPQLNSSWLCTCNTYMMMHAYVHGVYRTPYTRPVLSRNYFRSSYSISNPQVVLRFQRSLVSDCLDTYTGLAHGRSNGNVPITVLGACLLHRISDTRIRLLKIQLRFTLLVFSIPCAGEDLESGSRGGGETRARGVVDHLWFWIWFWLACFSLALICEVVGVMISFCSLDEHLSMYTYTYIHIQTVQIFLPAPIANKNLAESMYYTQPTNWVRSSKLSSRVQRYVLNPSVATSAVHMLWNTRRRATGAEKKR